MAGGSRGNARGGDTARGVGARPLVSVVVTAYNVEGFIRQAVASALAQTLERIEVIVVDDGSTDGTAAVLAQIDDPRLQTLRQSNQGASRARNTGLAAARAALVTFLDGDDYWHPEKLERQVRFMASRPQIDLSFTLCCVVDEAGRELVVPAAAPHRPLSFHDLLVENHIRNGSTVIVRRAVLAEMGGFDPDFPACNDYEAWLRVAAVRPRNVECLAEVLTFYRRREGQISADWRRMRDAFQALLVKMERIVPDQTRLARPGAVRNMHRYFALLAYKNGEISAAVSLLRASLASQPIGFFADSRSWLVAAAVANRAVLGSERSRALEHWAFRCWNWSVRRRVARQGATIKPADRKSLTSASQANPRRPLDP